MKKYSQTDEELRGDLLKDIICAGYNVGLMLVTMCELS